MKHADLQFWKVVRVRKEHLIFRQGSVYYLFTSKEARTRGSFLCIRRDEVERVREQLAASSVPEEFHCDDIWSKISGVHQGKMLKKKDKSYFITRLRNICYVLVANKMLEVRQRERRLYFFKRDRLSSPARLK